MTEEEYKKNLYEMYLKTNKYSYELALTCPADIKENFGVNLLFECSSNNPNYPKEDAFEKGMHLIALASKEGRKYAYSGAACWFTSDNKYAKGENTKKILEIYLAGVENCDLYSYFKLGEIYRCGLYGVASDDEKALEYYALGAKLNSPNCQFVLAKIYWLWHEGFKVEKDINLAKGLLEKACAGGYTDSKAYLAVLYHEELNDSQHGYKLLTEAVGEGSTAAYVFMGDWYTEGTVVDKDEEKAKDYYILAARMDNESAQKICKINHIEYLLKFTGQPRQVRYKEPVNGDETGEEFIRTNGITYDCLKRFDSYSLINGCYFRILDIIEKKYGSDCYNKILDFTTLENIFYSIAWFICELEEGGLKQYFMNANTITINGLLRALSDIGAEESFNIIAACQKYAKSAGDNYWTKKEIKLKEKLRHYVIDYMLENYPKELTI